MVGTSLTRLCPPYGIALAVTAVDTSLLSSRTSASADPGPIPRNLSIEVDRSTKLLIVAKPLPVVMDPGPALRFAACPGRRRNVYRPAFHAAVTSAIFATSGSRIADGVRENRGAGAGCVTP